MVLPVFQAHLQHLYSWSQKVKRNPKIHNYNCNMPIYCHNNWKANTCSRTNKLISNQDTACMCLEEDRYHNQHNQRWKLCLEIYWYNWVSSNITMAFKLMPSLLCFTSAFFSAIVPCVSCRARRARTRACILTMAWTHRRVPTAWLLTRCPRTADCNLMTLFSSKSALWACQAN